LDFALFGICAVWNLRRLEFAPFGGCALSPLRLSGFRALWNSAPLGIWRLLEFGAVWQFAPFQLI
jgi:hypothetical protein